MLTNTVQMNSTRKVPTGDGLNVTKEEDFSKWYAQVIIKGELIETCDISGFYILRPNACDLWDNIKNHMDKMFRRQGVRNAYFPLFVKKSQLQKESSHIEGFAPEVAWVTQVGSEELKDEDRLAVRPTSETIIYPIYSKWIKTYKDLPLRLNSWCNVVRWEFKHAIPFLRSREFLWQEGHSAFETKEEAEQEILAIRELYRHVYEDILAVPIIIGIKTEVEKFAGADKTLTCEAYVPEAKRAIQAATAHSLGQNFSQMFDISYVSRHNGQTEQVWQTSWGFTTRSIGICLMIHGDNKGLIFPPLVAPTNIVIIPHLNKKNNDEILEACNNLESTLADAGFRVHVDDRKDRRPGYKYAEWELKGVPVRLEIGTKELQQNKVLCVRRDNDIKSDISLVDIDTSLKELFSTIQREMLQSARLKRNNFIRVAYTSEEFNKYRDDSMILAPHCANKSCEDIVSINGIKSLCIPDNEIWNLPCLDHINDSDRTNVSTLDCFDCKQKAVDWVLFGKTY